MVPVFAAVFFSGHQNAHIISAAVFVAAGLTDLLDGYIARKYDLITPLGRVLDPLADKLLIFTALVCMAITGIAPWWAAAIYFIKETVQAIGGAALYKRIKDVPPSNILGKIAATVFYAIVTAFIIFNQMPYTLKIALLCGAILLAICAYGSYLKLALKLVKTKGPDENE